MFKCNNFTILQYNFNKKTVFRTYLCNVMLQKTINVEFKNLKHLTDKMIIIYSQQNNIKKAKKIQDQSSNYLI